MKTKFTWFCIIAIVILGISTFFVGCKDDMNDMVVYKGQVVYINTTTPFPDLTVKVTDGYNTHCQTQTDAGGLFSLNVRISEINNDYYLLAGDSTCVPKKVKLFGFDQTKVDLGVIEVEGPALPTVRTNKELTSLTADAAVLGGEVLTDGRLSVTARGICYGTKAYPTIDGPHTIEGAGLGSFSSHLENLEHNTIYYARAYATNSKGTAYDTAQVKFTTEEGVAIVITDSVYQITAHSAKCKGHVESDGGYPVTDKGTCWSKYPDPTIDDNRSSAGSGLGVFTCTLTNLEENTSYYVRTYATNSTKTTYGEDTVITTLDGLAVVVTDSIPKTSITATSFTAYGTVLKDCDIQVTERGFCYSKKQYPTIDDQYKRAGKGLGAFHATISGLDYATTYYVRAYAINATETAYDSLQYEITTLSGLPKVTTDSVATNIGSVKATCRGEVTDDGTIGIIERGICYGTEPQLTIDGAHESAGKGTGVFTCNLKNLKDKTTYYFCAYATTDAGTSYGKEYTFKTEDGYPVVLLTQLCDTTSNSVTCKGNVTGDGGLTVTERGFCYSVSQYPTNTDAHVVIGNGTGEFSGSLTKLNINTTYYVRAYAINSIGVGYSEQKSFTTRNGLPTVMTKEATSSATTITIGGHVTDNGGYAVTERGVCYSVSNFEPTITDEIVEGGQGNGEYSVTITGLTANTTYYVRAYAKNTNGPAYGKAVPVTTKDGNASVLLGEITDITAQKASASVTVNNTGSATLQSCGICWSTNPTPTTADNKTTASGKALNVAYPCNMTELQPGTTYYVRAYATTDVTTAYSEQRTFTTKQGSATVILGDISDITALSASTSVSVTDANGATLQSCGVCWSTNPNPTTADYKTAASGKALNVTYPCNMTDLQPDTKYYVRAYAITDIAPSYSEARSFSTSIGKPIVATGTATTTATTITCAGNVSDNGGYAVTERGICYSQTNSEPTILDQKIASGSGNGEYKVTIKELTPATSYHVRAYATNTNGTSYGDAKVITTKNGEATIVLESINNITALTASGKVMVTDAGGAALQSCGICWSTNPNPTINDNKTVASGKSINTSYICNMTNLQPKTNYYVRGYVITDLARTSYSPQKQFETKDGLPVLNTTTTTATSTKITSGGNITSDGGYSITARGICYSTTNSEPTIEEDEFTSNGSGAGTYTSVITNVSINTTYYVRAYATNVIGTAYGDAIVVTTGNGLPSVTTTVIGENVTSTTAVGGGNVTDDGGFAVTARGVCWSTTPSPTISNYHTTDGNGKGYFTSNITNIDITGDNVYYVRAYATNINGTVYGETVIISKENLDYANLPSFQYGGYTYKLYNDIGTMNLESAYSACDGMTFGGYDDWFLPDMDELRAAFNATKEGWKVDEYQIYDSYIERWGNYWTSSESGSYWYYATVTVRHYSNGNTYDFSQSPIKYTDMVMYHVRPVRKYKTSN